MSEYSKDQEFLDSVKQRMQDQVQLELDDKAAIKTLGVEAPPASNGVSPAGGGVILPPAKKETNWILVAGIAAGAVLIGLVIMKKMKGRR